MKITAKLNHLRIAPRKVRLVADMVRRKNIDTAQEILRFTVKKASLPILKLLNSALANAKNNHQIEPDNLYISKITVDEGPKLKRWRPRARGRAFPIEKKTSHISLELEEIKPGKKTKKKIEKKQQDVVEKKDPPQIKKPKPKAEISVPKLERKRGIKRMFRRKSF